MTHPAGGEAHLGTLRADPALSHHAEPEALILGGGLAGAAVAIHLARAGRSTLLLEQQSQPQHKVCGEFLSREAIHYLTALSIDVPALGAVPITHVRLVRRDVVAESPLPFTALSLTRRTLDEALLKKAACAGALVHRGQRVDSLTETSADTSSGRSCWQAKLADGTQYAAPTAFLATGKHDLRGYPRPAGRQNDLIAFKQYFRLSPGQAAALSQHVELVLFPGGYVGLQPVEPDATGAPVANLCLLVRRQDFARLASWPRLLDHIQQNSPHLAGRLAEAMPILEKPLALSGIPYGHLATNANPTEPNLWRLGDQTAVIPSFSGDGMSLALHTAALAANLYLQGSTSADFHARLRQTLGRQITLATTLSRTLVASPALAAVTTRLFPGLLPRAATATRISESALL